MRDRQRAIGERESRQPDPLVPALYRAPLSNRAVGALLSRAAVSTPAVSDPGSEQERQADAVARSATPLGAVEDIATIHTGPMAASVAHGVGARAVTSGSDIFFGAGQYAPADPDGRLLLRHELAHVLQQDPDGARRLVGGEPLRRAQPGTMYREVPGPQAPVEDPKVTQFKRQVFSRAKQQLRMSSESLSLWDSYLSLSLGPRDAAAQMMAAVGRDLFATARDTSSEPQYEQWSKTTNPAMREVLDNQIHGRWRACTGCHATIEADSWAKKQVQIGPEWEAPVDRMTRTADELGRPAIATGGGTAGGYGLSAQEAAVWPSTVATLSAADRIGPQLNQLGDRGYKVLPDELFTSMSGLSDRELLTEVQNRIKGRQGDYAELITEIDDGSIDAFLFLPIVDSMLSSADEEVRAAVTAEIERRGLREKARDYTIGGAGLLALLLMIFPPTALLGVALGVGVSAASLAVNVDTAMTGATIREGHGAGVFSAEQEQKADEMLVGGIFGAVMSAVDLIAGATALHAMTRPAPGGALALPEPAGTALRPGASMTQGEITITMSADGALFATHSGDPTAFVVVQNGIARGYRFRNGTFELVGTRPVGRPGPWSGEHAPGPWAAGDEAAAAIDGAGTPLLPAPTTPFAADADLVWVNTKSGVFHNQCSPWYGTTKDGQYMVRADAVAAGHREAQGGTAAAAEGVRKHEMVKNAQRPFEGQEHEGKWVLEAVERTVGGTKRVDELWINHDQKRILVVDTYTGPVESLPHYLKGWAYAREPDIQALISQGYRYEYQVSYHHPDKLQ